MNKPMQPVKRALRRIRQKTPAKSAGGVKVKREAQATYFKPQINRWHNLINAFQTPLRPLDDSIHLGSIPGQFIEHASGGDYPIFFGGRQSANSTQALKKKLTELKSQVGELKAANELLTRFQKENADPRLRLLRALRHASSEPVIHRLAECSELSIIEVANDVACLELLLELARSGFLEIGNGRVNVTESGKAFLSKKLRLHI